MTEDYSKIAVRFQRGLISRRDLLSHLSKLIIQVPGKFGIRDKDFIQDFYVEIASNIDKEIKYYKIVDDANFLTWFHLVLKQRLFKFLKKWKDDECKRNSFLCELLSYNDLPIFHYDNEIDKTNQKINLASLSKTEKKVFNLKYNLDKSKKTKVIIKKLQRKRELEDILGNKFYKLINIRKKITYENEEEKIKELKLNEQKIVKSKRYIEELYKSINLYKPHKDIAKRIKVSSLTVGSYMNRIKTKLEYERDNDSLFNMPKQL